MPNFPVLPPRAAVNEPVTVYHALPYGLRDPLNHVIVPEIFVDISAVVATKRKMLAMHKSQKQWLDVSQGIDSYLVQMENMSREVGEMSGCYAFAEGWTRHLHLGYCDESANPLLHELPTALVAKHPSAST
jgi:LmbE family N-acetylglucosaminyl deacetylase